MIGAVGVDGGTCVGVFDGVGVDAGDVEVLLVVLGHCK